MRCGPLWILISLPIAVLGIPVESLCHSWLCCSSLTSPPIFSQNPVLPTSLSPPLWLAVAQLVLDCFLLSGFCSPILTRTYWHDVEQSQQLSTRWRDGQLAREKHFLTCPWQSMLLESGVCKRASIFSFWISRLTNYPKLCRSVRQPMCT